MAKKITGTQLKTLKTKCETDNVDEAYICKSFHIIVNEFNRFINLFAISVGYTITNYNKVFVRYINFC